MRSTFHRLACVLCGSGILLLAAVIASRVTAQTIAPGAESDPATFCRAHLGLLESADIERILGDYAETVKWYKDGAIDHDFIRQDKGKLYADWKTVRYEADGPIRVHKTGETTEVSFRSVFAAASGPPKDRRSVGRAENVWQLRWTGNAWQIVSENQKITAHELPPATVAQLFARSPGGGGPTPTAAIPSPAPRAAGAGSAPPAPLPRDLAEAVAAYRRLRQEARTDLVKGMNVGSAARAAKTLAESRLASDPNNPRLLIVAAESSAFCRDLAKADEYAARAAALLANAPAREQDARADALSVGALVIAQVGASLTPPALARLEALVASAMQQLQQPGVPRDSESARHARAACEEAVDSMSPRNVGLYPGAMNMAGGRPKLEELRQQATVARCALRVFASISEPEGWSEAGATKNLAAVDHALGLYYQEPGAWEEGVRLMERLPDLPGQRTDLPDLATLAEGYGAVCARLGKFTVIEKLAGKAAETAANAALAGGAQPFVAEGIRARLAALRKIYPTKDDSRAVVGGGLLTVDNQPLPERTDGAGFQMLGGGEGTSVVFNPDASLQGAGDEYDWDRAGPVVSRSNRLLAVPKSYAQNRRGLGGNCAIYDLQAGLALGTVILPETQFGASKFDTNVALAFSPDDRFLVLGYPERVYVCDLNSGRLAYSLALPGVKSLAINAAGRQLICATLGSVYRCDLPTGASLQRSNLPRGVDDLRLSEDASRLTAWSRTGPEEMTCASWELASGRASAHFTFAVSWADARNVVFLGAERITSLQATGAARPLSAGGPWPPEKWRVRQWDAHDGRLALDRPLKETLPGSPSDARAFDVEALWNVSASGRWLTRQRIRFTTPGTKGPAALYYDLTATGNGPLSALEREEGFGRHFSPNEQFTVGVKGDDLLLGDFQRGLFAKTLQPAERLGASGLAFTRAGNRLAVSYDDGSLRIFDLPHSRLERSLALGAATPGKGGVERAFYSRPEFSPDDRYLLVRRETFGRHPVDSFEVYRVDTGASIMSLRSDNAPVFSPGGRFLILDGAGTGLYSKTEPISIENVNTLRIYDLDAGGRCVGWFNEQTCGDVSPDGSTVISIGADKLLHVWDLASGKQLVSARLSDSAAAGQLALPGGADARVIILRDDGIEAWTRDAASLRQTYCQTLPPTERGRQLRDFRIDPTGRFALTHRTKNGTLGGAGGGPDGEYLDLWSLDDGKHLRGLQEPLMASFGYAFDDAGRLALRTVAQPSPGSQSREKVEVYRTGDAQVVAKYDFPNALPANQENQAGGLAFGGGRLARLEMGSDFVNSVALSDAASGARLATVHSFFPDGDALVAPDGVYAASKSILQRLGVRVGNQIFPFEQFDLRLNRPDLLAARLGGDKEAVSPLEMAYRKRLARMGIKTESPGDNWNLPTISLDRSALPPIATGDTLPVRVTARDDKHPLDRLQFFVNDVPVFGAEGLKVPADTKIGTPYEKTVPVPLAAGANKVQVSVFNAQGIESLRETFAVTRGSGAAKPRLFLITVAVKSYPGANGLAFPVDDAQGVADFFRRTTGKDYAEVKTLPLLEGDAVREKILAAREFLLGSKVDDTAIVYVAGHGLLDNDSRNYFFAPIDMDFAAPAKRGVSYEQLEGLLDGIPALRKLLVLDTCAAGEREPDAPALAAPAGTLLAAAGVPGGGPRGRGVAGVRPAEKKGTADARLLESFADLRRGSGAMVIAAAGAEEEAFEQGGHGYFTGSLLEGLGGGQADLNGDGQITVTELREYAARRVRGFTAGAQQPVLRRENLEMDFPVCAAPPHRADATAAVAAANADTDEQATLPFLRGMAEAYAQALARGDVEQSMRFFSTGTVKFDGAAVTGSALRTRLADLAERWKGWKPQTVGNPKIRSIKLGSRAPGTEKIGDDSVEFAMTFQGDVSGANASPAATRAETLTARFVAADAPPGKTWTVRRWQITEMKLAPLGK